MNNKAKIEKLNAEIEQFQEKITELESQVLRLMFEDRKAEIVAFGKSHGFPLAYDMKIICTQDICEHASNRRSRAGFFVGTTARVILAYNDKIRLSWGDDSAGWEDNFPPEMIRDALLETKEKGSDS